MRLQPSRSTRRGIAHYHLGKPERGVIPLLDERVHRVGAPCDTPKTLMKREAIELACQKPVGRENQQSASSSRSPMEKVASPTTGSI